MAAWPARGERGVSGDPERNFHPWEDDHVRDVAHDENSEETKMQCVL